MAILRSKKRKVPGMKEANPLELLLTTLLGVVAIGYAVITFSTQDPLWFMPNTSFDRQPTRIEVYHEGEQHILLPGDEGYAALTEALNERIIRMTGYWEIGLREEVLQEAYEQHTSVVFVYNEPIRLHTRWNLGRPNNLFIPVTGSYSNEDRIYTGTNGRYGHGAIVVEDMEGFRQVVRDLGYRK